MNTFLRRRYLNSFDYTAELLAYFCRKTPGRANHFILAMDLPRNVPIRKVETFLAPLNKLGNFLHGRMTRHPFNLAPQWKPGRAPFLRITETASGVQEQEKASPLSTFSNEPLTRDAALEVRLLRTSADATRVLFKFSHRLFDGYGAELLLAELARLSEGTAGSPALFERRIPGFESAHLNDWKHQFACGDKLRAWLRETDNPHPVAALSAPTDAAANLRFHSFRENESANILRRAEEIAGPFLLMPYLFAETARILTAEVLDKEGIRGDIRIPSSVNLRGREDDLPADDAFFNQWSLLPLSVSREAARTRTDAVHAVRESLFEATRADLPHVFRHAAFLTRIAPIPLAARIAKKFSAQINGTFMGSFLPESVLRGVRFFDTEPTNLFHCPTMPPAPGLGVFFNTYANKLNLIVSSRTGVLPESCLERFFHTLTETLQGDSP